MRQQRRGFTLVELLIVVAVVALLLALLLPALQRARMQAKVVRVHSDLRQIGLALDQYLLDQRDALPPARSACGTPVLNQLPVELADGGYLPPSPSKIPQSHFLDLFRPTETYKYIAPGATWYNGSFFDLPGQTWRPRSKLWVPDDFPHNQSKAGRYFADLPGEAVSPARFAVWSIGPDPESPRFPRISGTDQVDTAHFPLPRPFWLRQAGDTGLITHFRNARGHDFMSP